MQSHCVPDIIGHVFLHGYLFSWCAKRTLIQELHVQSPPWYNSCIWNVYAMARKKWKCIYDRQSDIELASDFHQRFVCASAVCTLGPDRAAPIRCASALVATYHTNADNSRSLDDLLQWNFVRCRPTMSGYLGLSETWAGGFVYRGVCICIEVLYGKW